jgi:hypothetical protein
MNLKSIIPTFMYIFYKAGGSENKFRESQIRKFANLKVPKCEIFDLFDFNDFYVIKSLWLGDFRDEIKKYFFLMWARYVPFCLC